MFTLTPFLKESMMTEQQAPKQQRPTFELNMVARHRDGTPKLNSKGKPHRRAIATDDAEELANFFNRK